MEEDASSQRAQTSMSKHSNGNGIALHNCSNINHYANELRDIRKAVESHGLSAEDIDDPTLLRFLKARSMRAEKAAKMLVQHQNWRASFVPHGYICDTEVENELASAKCCLQGASKKGWPLIILLANKHHPNKANFEELKRFIVHLLDKSIASALTESKDQKIMVVVDLSELGFKNIDVKAMITAFQFLQNYYPERLAKLYMVNAPYIFFSAWKIVSRCLDTATKEKILFLQGAHEISKALLEEVDADILPSNYGGKANLILLQNVHLQNWPPKESK